MKGLYALIWEDIDGYTPNIRVYADAIESVYAYFTYVRSQIMVDSMSEETIDSYCALFDIPFDLSEAERKRLISERFALKYEAFDMERLRADLKQIDESIDIESDNFEVKIKALNPQDEQAVHSVLKLVGGCCALFVTVGADGDGLTFDEWDALDKSFMELDFFDCPFSVLETL